jgi:hypothetical protein
LSDSKLGKSIIKSFRKSLISKSTSPNKLQKSNSPVKKNKAV